jgi:EAL domain-containing protein (putative c-di-GMP-specific phosphodiesterase class I)
MPMDVKQALEARQFYIAYQPLVDLQRKTVFAYEALVRSEAPEFPNALGIIRDAVEARFMGTLGRSLRRMAIDGCPSYPLFLNIHPDEFDEAWLVRPDDSITEHDKDIYLEITESVPLSHYRHCHSVLREIRAKGVKVAIDDLGAGYSNLKYIADLSPEVVKLDRELIANLSRGSRLHTLVCSIVDLCRRQGARVVAEGIETREEMLAVLDTGAHYGQGYFLARPDRELPTVEWSKLGL